MFVNLCIITIFVLLPGSLTIPAQDNLVVGSYVREVRAAPPIDLKSAATNDDYDNGRYKEDDGSVGYLKKTEDGGADGYKHFDSYHKKDGDKYGYEKHSAFGVAKKYVDDGDKGGDKKAQGTHESYRVAEDINEYDDGPVGELNEYSSAESDGGDGEAGHYTQGNSGESESYRYGGPESYTNEGDAEDHEEYNEESEDYD